MSLDGGGGGADRAGSPRHARGGDKDTLQQHDRLAATLAASWLKKTTAHQRELATWARLEVP